MAVSEAVQRATVLGHSEAWLGAGGASSVGGRDLSRDHASLQAAIGDDLWRALTAISGAPV
jgi:hypothetical protein